MGRFRPLILNENFARMRNEELGMKVAASPRIYMGRCPKGRIGHRRYERQMRKAEKCAAYVWKRETLTANDNDLISAS